MGKLIDKKIWSVGVILATAAFVTGSILYGVIITEGANTKSAKEIKTSKRIEFIPLVPEDEMNYYKEAVDDIIIIQHKTGCKYIFYVGNQKSGITPLLTEGGRPDCE